MKENTFTNYVKTSLEELTKVTWPTKNQAVKLTVITLAFCAFFGVFLGLIDLAYNELFKLVINL